MQARPAHSKAAPLTLKPLYIDSLPPTKVQQTAAQKFFADHVPIKSWTAAEWRQDAYSDNPLLTPEIVFLGRSNVGKSSLLNSIFGSNECRVGSKPGKTKLMHAWNLARQPPPYRVKGKSKAKMEDKDYEPKLVLLDMPGYGYGSRSDWGEDIMKYLTRRRQLRRAFLLVSPKHGFKDADIKMLELLQAEGISHQLIATKCDELARPQAVQEALEKLSREVKSHLGGRQVALQTLNDILAVGGVGDGAGNNRVRRNEMRGVPDVMWAVLRASGLDGYAMRAAGLATLDTQAQMQTKKSDESKMASIDHSHNSTGVETPASQPVGPADIDHTIAHPPSSPRETISSEPTIGLSISDFLSTTVATPPSPTPNPDHNSAFKPMHASTTTHSTPAPEGSSYTNTHAHAHSRQAPQPPPLDHHTYQPAPTDHQHANTRNLTKAQRIAMQRNTRRSNPTALRT